MKQTNLEKISNCIVNSTVSMQFGNQSLLDLRKFIQKDAQDLFSRIIKGGLAGFYMEDDLPCYCVTDEFLAELGYEYSEFVDEFQNCLLKTVHPDDRDDYSTCLERGLHENGYFQAITRIRHKNGTYMWMQDIGKKIADATGKPFVLFVRSNVTDILEKNRVLEEKAAIYEEKGRQLESLTANIPGGVCEVALDTNYTLTYGNDGFYKLFGYTPQQMRQEHQNHLFDLIFEKDRDYVKKIIDCAYEKKELGFEYEHRILRRDQSIIWVLVRGNFSIYQNSPLFNCVLIDITDRKRIEDEARMSEKRFRIALAQTDNSIFEYDIRTHVMIHGNKSAEYYGLEDMTEDVPDVLVRSGTVHPDSAYVFLQMYDRISKGEPNASCVIKAKLAEGTYVWQKISMTTIFDENGKPVKAIGFLEDIDEQMRREESLRYQSERDALTGLFNRGAVIQRIHQELLGRMKEQTCALIILDIDSFKSVNDCYGHMFGDYVLSESSKRLSALFRKSEIIGRIGGDEFVVFLTDTNSGNTAISCARRIIQIFQKPFENRGISISVSSSVGTAVCPANGKTFEELYQNADIALYEAKKNGKNKAMAYDSHMAMHGEWRPYSSTVIDME